MDCRVGHDLVSEQQQQWLKGHLFPAVAGVFTGFLSKYIYHIFIFIHVTYITECLAFFLNKHIFSDIHVNMKYKNIQEEF